MKYVQSVETRYEEFFNLTGETSTHVIGAGLSYPRFNKLVLCPTPTESPKLRPTWKSNCNNNPQKNDDFFRFELWFWKLSWNYWFKKKSGFNNFNFFRRRMPWRRSFRERYLVLKVFIKYNTPMPAFGSFYKMFSFATMLKLPRSHNISHDLFAERLIMKSH